MSEKRMWAVLFVAAGFSLTFFAGEWCGKQRGMRLLRESQQQVLSDWEANRQAESEGGCVRCEKEDCAREGECCKCPEPDPGETFDYDGCEGNETRPYLGDAYMLISEGGAAEAKKYAKKLLAMYPDMRGWLAERWRKMFAN